VSRVLFEIAPFCKCLSEIAFMRQLASHCPPVCLPVCSVSKNDGRVFVKYGPGDLYENSWHTQFRFQSNKIGDNSNKSPTRCNNFPVYYPDIYLQLNMFRDNKLENCCIWLVIYLNCTMMHGLKNLEIKRYFTWFLEKPLRAPRQYFAKYGGYTSEQKLFQCLVMSL